MKSASHSTVHSSVAAAAPRMRRLRGEARGLLAVRGIVPVGEDQTVASVSVRASLGRGASRFSVRIGDEEQDAPVGVGEEEQAVHRVGGAVR